MSSAAGGMSSIWMLANRYALSMSMVLRRPWKSELFFSKSVSIDTFGSFHTLWYLSDLGSSPLSTRLLLEYYLLCWLVTGRVRLSADARKIFLTRVFNSPLKCLGCSLPLF